jgi:3-isopropylmalate dehydrogenase
MESSIAVLPGDGVGPEVMTQARNVLQAVGERFGDGFNFDEGFIGGVATDGVGRALSYEALRTIVGYAEARLERRIVLNMPRSDWRGQ